jgi:4-methylaminobutanoate oxidase (formaldehyde-forming)
VSDRALPRTVDVVIVGGGILGLSVAWHLARAGGVRVVVVERLSLASQATARAAALISLGRKHGSFTRLVQRTFAAIDELGDALGEPLPLHRHGSLSIACSADCRQSLQALISVSSAEGVAFEHLTANRSQERVPWLALPEDALCAFCPEDAFIDPGILAMAYATAARRAGATIVAGVTVTGLRLAGGRVAGVGTTEGDVAAAVVVVAAGAWSNLLGASIGRFLPMAPVRSQYWITVPDAVFPRQQPSVLLTDARAYTRPELGALLLGLRETEGVSVDPGDLPEDTSGYAFADDPSGMQSLAAGFPALRRFLPALDTIGIRHHIAGFSTYAPDGLPVFGAVGDMPGLLFAGGCSGAGIAISGAVGLTLAELALGREASLDIRAYRTDRFGPVDPFEPGFRTRCAGARSGKQSA